MWILRDRDDYMPYLQEMIETEKRRRKKPQHAMRCRLAKIVVPWLHHGTGTGYYKSQAELLVGCTKRQLEAHMSSFGLCYRNTLGFHIDHIRPCKSFDLLDIDQIFVCCNWRNLRPLPIADNLSKGAKWTPKDEEDWAFMMRAMGFTGELFLHHTRTVEPPDCHLLNGAR